MPRACLASESRPTASRPVGDPERLTSAWRTPCCWGGIVSRHTPAHKRYQASKCGCFAGRLGSIIHSLPKVSHLREVVRWRKTKIQVTSRRCETFGRRVLRDWRSGTPMKPHLLAVAVPSGAVAFAEAPRPHRRRRTIPSVTSLKYATPEAVQAAWKPMSGTAGAEAVESRAAEHFACAATSRAHASSGRPGTERDRHLFPKRKRSQSPPRGSSISRPAQGVPIDIFCADASPVSGFSLYFHSGGGWYGTTSRPSGPPVPREDREDRHEDGRHALRLGGRSTPSLLGLAGKNADTEFYVANLGLLGADASIAIIAEANPSPKCADQVQSVSVFTKAVADSLDRLGSRVSSSAIGD